MIYVLIEPGK